MTKKKKNRRSLEPFVRPAFILALLITLPACSSVQESYLHPDYERVDRNSLKRVRIYAESPSGAPAAVADLMGRMAREYVNQKKNYLIVGIEPAPNPPAVPIVEEPLDGLIYLRPTRVTKDGDDVHMEIMAMLFRKSGEKVWYALARDTEAAKNEDLEKMTGVWVRRVGEAVRPYVAPLFVLYKDLFESLPSPVLTEGEEWEKIELESEW